LLSLFLVGAAPASFAQDEPPCGWGYLFSWKPNFDIGKFHVGSVYNSVNDKLPLVGIGAEKYLTNRLGLQFGVDFGMDNTSQEDSVRTVDNNVMDIGLKVGLNYYFHGMDKTISPYVGGWASYSLYNETLTDKPVTGTEFERKYSASTIGLGLTGGAYWQPWDDTDLDFGFYYNLGVMITPKSTLEITAGGQTAKTEGPSRFSAGDCGGGINLRLSF
jgi:hypothetical protein